MRKRPLTLEQQADMADSEMIFEKKYNEALGDSWREDVRKKTVALYAENPCCAVCREEIPDSSRAILWEPMDSPAFIICERAECQLKALNSSMTRYLKQNMNAVHVPKEYRRPA